MSFYLASFTILVLLFYRIFRTEKFREKWILSSFFLALLLGLSGHPWFLNSSPWIRVLEKTSWLTALLWLAAEPVAAWIEKRRAGQRAFILLKNGKGALHEIVLACRMLVQSKQGALIAIEKKTPLDQWIQSGVSLDAKIRKETIYSLFTPPGALHDGGMIIRGDRISACGVVFPLSKRLDLPTELGTRHRAALGLSEATDALTLVVSEETGKISLAIQGSLLYDVKMEMLSETLEKGLRNQWVRAKREIRTSGKLKEKELVFQ